MPEPGVWSPSAHAVSHPDGSIVVMACEPPASFGPRLSDPMLTHARNSPDRLALADRKGTGGDWRQLSYSGLSDQSARVGQAFLDMGLGPDRPLLLITENRIEAAVATFAAYRAGVPLAPITPAYSAGRGDMDRLTAILATLKPGLAVVNDASVHAHNLSRAAPDLPIISMVEGVGAPPFKSLLAAIPSDRLWSAEARVDANTVAKILFTSGSTGTPKGAINTQRMLTSNVAAIRQGWPFLEDEPPTLVDWLPWNHTFGGNFVLNTMIASGGSLYIDDGAPTPEGMIRSIANAAEIRPTLHLNVPRGLDLAARVLAESPQQAEAFFERLRVVFFASAGLPARIRQSWIELIERHARRPVRFCSAWGATETSPLATVLNFDATQVNNIGVPIPGVEIKLAPQDGRLELRVRGPNVTPGYLDRADLTAKAFDDEGFWKSGDAGCLADPDDPRAGILIEGRLAEDFKLTSGIWVNVGGLRAQLLEACGPIVRDIVISGPNRSDLGAIVFLDAEQCARRFDLAADWAQLSAAESVRQAVAAAIDAHNLANTGSSRRIEQFRLLARALDPAAGELTEKGTVNQGVVLKREAELCEEMHRAASHQSNPMSASRGRDAASSQP